MLQFHQARYEFNEQAVRDRILDFTSSPIWPASSSSGLFTKEEVPSVGLVETFDSIFDANAKAIVFTPKSEDGTPAKAFVISVVRNALVNYAKETPDKVIVAGCHRILAIAIINAMSDITKNPAIEWKSIPLKLGTVAEADRQNALDGARTDLTVVDEIHKLATLFPDKMAMSGPEIKAALNKPECYWKKGGVLQRLIMLFKAWAYCRKGGKTNITLPMLVKGNGGAANTLYNPAMDDKILATEGIEGVANGIEAILTGEKVSRPKGVNSKVVKKYGEMLTVPEIAEFAMAIASGDETRIALATHACNKLNIVR